MPNWCDNYLQVEGDPKQLAELLDGFDKDNNEDHQVRFLTKHAPLSTGDWEYGTAINEWGTKWDLANFHHDYEPGKNYAYIRFESAWAPPVEGMRRVSEKFTDLVFGLSWMENGMCFYGHCALLNGKVYDLVDADIPNFYDLAAEQLGRDPDYDADDPEVCDLATDKEHELWIAIDDRAAASMKLAQVYAHKNVALIPKEDS